MSDLWRQRVSQDLWVCVEDSRNIVLEARSADGSQVLSRKLVSNVDRLTEKLAWAREYVIAAEDDEHAARMLASARYRAGQADDQDPGDGHTAAGYARNH